MFVKLRERRERCRVCEASSARHALIQFIIPTRSVHRVTLTMIFHQDEHISAQHFEEALNLMMNVLGLLHVSSKFQKKTKKWNRGNWQEHILINCIYFDHFVHVCEKPNIKYTCRLSKNIILHRNKKHKKSFKHLRNDLKNNMNPCITH